MGDLCKVNVDEMAKSGNIDEVLDLLNKLKVTKLRNLAREYNEFGIAGRLISNADKNLLMEEFKKYYEKH